jgi:hypothetical protein
MDIHTAETRHVKVRRWEKVAIGGDDDDVRTPSPNGLEGIGLRSTVRLEAGEAQLHGHLRDWGRSERPAPTRRSVRPSNHAHHLESRGQRSQTGNRELRRPQKYHSHKGILAWPRSDGCNFTEGWGL